MKIVQIVLTVVSKIQIFLTVIFQFEYFLTGKNFQTLFGRYLHSLSFKFLMTVENIQIDLTVILKIQIFCGCYFSI
jgi:hypothetical protein